MTYQSISPIKFGTKSLVTTSLGKNDPEPGAFDFDEDGRYYQFVYNDGGEQVAAGLGVVPAAGTSTGYSVTVSAATSADLVVGVVRHATITTAAYGWVVVRGVTSVKMAASSGTVATGGLIEVGANGVGVPVSNTTGNKSPAYAKALNTIASSGTGDAFVRCF